MSRWTNWLSRHPFTMKITGSNPVRDTKSKIMKYVFRGHVVFEYKPNDKKVTSIDLRSLENVTIISDNFLNDFNIKLI